MAPSIVFFDELDSLVGKRVEGEQTNEVTARILSSFLTEMDGLELAQGVLVMGATNRPQALDAALVRQAFPRGGRGGAGAGDGAAHTVHIAMVALAFCYPCYA